MIFYIPLLFLLINLISKILLFIHDLVNKSHDTYLILVVIKYFTFDHKHDHDYCIT